MNWNYNLTSKDGMTGLSSIDGITCLSASMFSEPNLAGASPINLLDRLGGLMPCAGFDDALRFETAAAAEV